MFTSLVVRQRCDRDVGRSFGWKRLSCYEVLFISQRTGMVGRMKACRSETIVHAAEIRSARHDVVVRIKEINTQSVPEAQIDPDAPASFASARERLSAIWLARRQSSQAA
jgi:hypothetical protein